MKLTFICAAGDRKKKVKITLEKSDFDEVKHEHDLNHTHTKLFSIHRKVWKEEDTVRIHIIICGLSKLFNTLTKTDQEFLSITCACFFASYFFSKK